VTPRALASPLSGPIEVCRWLQVLRLIGRQQAGWWWHPIHSLHVMAMTSNQKQSDLFNEQSSKKRTLPNEAHKLREMGLIRIQGIIPLELNEDIKSMARIQNMNADILVGEIIQSATRELTKTKARLAAKQLQEQFGDAWLEILGDVAQ